MATLYKATGERLENLHPSNKSKGWQLDELYSMLNCELVETVSLPNNKIMIVDEEGALKENNILNVGATVLARTYIMGNALVCNSDEFK